MIFFLGLTKYCEARQKHVTNCLGCYHELQLHLISIGVLGVGGVALPEECFLITIEQIYFSPLHYVGIVKTMGCNMIFNCSWGLCIVL